MIFFHKVVLSYVTWDSTHPTDSVHHTHECVSVVDGQGYGKIAHADLRVHHYHLDAWLMCGGGEGEGKR